MKEIRYLEEKIWNLMKISIEKKESKRIAQLNTIVQDIERIKKEAQKVEHAIENIESNKFEESEKSTSWEITQGAIKQNYLSITKAIKNGLIPTDEREFEVETSVGQVFKTDALSPANRLRERGKIAEFYQKSKIKSGDKVLWREVAPLRYHLSKLEEMA